MEAQTRKTILQTEKLSKQYGTFMALDHVSLTVRQGDIYGLIGRNGAGKTTLFKCIMGLAKPTGGGMTIAGERRQLNRARGQMGFMINPSFFPYLNPRENLQYLCRMKGIGAKTEVDRLLKLVELEGVRKPFKDFSLGMKQRLGIAGAMLGNPQMVLLDEPINGLDPQGIIDIRNLIRAVHRQTGTGFLVSSHILSELDLVATRFGFIDHGVLLKEISHSELHEHTKKMLVIQVENGPRAKALLEKAGIQGVLAADNLLRMDTNLDKSHEIARMLVEGGLAVYDLHRQENTLEEYFMRLVGGGKDA